MAKIVVTESEIQAAERLRGEGAFAAALVLTQELLMRAQDDNTRLRLLFDVLYCSTNLGEDAITSEAIEELEQLPQHEESGIFINFIQAMSHISHGRAQEGLDLIERNLRTRFMGNADSQIWKYKHLAYKGSALIWLSRAEEALVALNEAHAMYPDGERETAILIDQANCLLALDRYEDAYRAASEVLSRDSGEMAVLANYYMAECRMWQGRVLEALEIYSSVQKRLPCRLVQEQLIHEGIRKCMSYLEKISPRGKPS